MTIYGIDTLAYYDSMRSGLVPCKVTRIVPDAGGVTLVTAVVTADRYAYKRGETITYSGHFIVPRNHVKRNRIISGYLWR